MTHIICVHSDDKQYKEKFVGNTRYSSQSFNYASVHKTKQNNNALNNTVWVDSETVYWQNDSDYKWISEKDQETIIKFALLESSFETPLVIRKRNRKTADAQIKINWLKKKDEKYFTSNGILAFAYGPGQGLGGDCTMNADVLWLAKNKDSAKLTVKEAYDLGYIENYNREFPNSIIKSYDPLHTLKHEVGGHALGMNHITDVKEKYFAVMYPYYNGLRKFGTADLAYLHQLYGKSKLSHKIKEMLLNRIYRGLNNY